MVVLNSPVLLSMSATIATLFCADMESICGCPLNAASALSTPSSHLATRPLRALSSSALRSATEAAEYPEAVSAQLQSTWVIEPSRWASRSPRARAANDRYAERSVPLCTRIRTRRLAAQVALLAAAAPSPDTCTRQHDMSSSSSTSAKTGGAKWPSAPSILLLRTSSESHRSGSQERESSNATPCMALRSSLWRKLRSALLCRNARASSERTSAGTSLTRDRDRKELVRKGSID